MDFHLIWKAILIVLVGTALLRIGGKKTIAEMTTAQTVLLISIGTLLIQPVTSKNIWITFLIAAVIVAVLLALEMVQVKSDGSESLITGQSSVLVKDGVLQEQTMKRERMTVDQLETRLRQHNVANITDLEWATLEPSGKIGFVLKEHAKPATKGDIQKLMNAMNSGRNTNSPPIVSSESDEALFSEIDEGYFPPP